MSFAEKHPYLFWQLIGWGILLIDFVFVVIAVFNDFGEWSYPIIVFTFIGALFLGVVAILPIVLSAVFQISGLSLGGTSLLIVVGVALDTSRSLESYMLMRHHKGFLE